MENNLTLYESIVAASRVNPHGMAIYYQNKRIEWIKYIRFEKNRHKNLVNLSKSDKYSKLMKEVDDLYALYRSTGVDGKNPNKELHEEYSKQLDGLFKSDLYKQYEEERKKFEWTGNYGPGVRVSSKRDLLNKKLKLPIYDKPFSKICHDRNFSRFRADCFGKTFIPDPYFKDPSGIVIGYE